MALEALEAEMNAMRPSSSMRKASRSMGTRLVRTWLRVRPDSPVQVLPPDCRVLTLPVAFGVVCAASNVELVPALEGFAYTRLAAAASAAMRLMAIGQHESHSILADLLGDASDVVDHILCRSDRPMAFVPALDVAAMRQQYVHSRLFRS
jgi:urease accessory protein UreF